MTTNDYDVVGEKVRLGWSFEFTQNGFWLRAPDLSLVDITEPFRIYQMGESVDNLSCFRYLKDLQRACGLPDLINGVIFKGGIDIQILTTIYLKVRFLKGRSGLELQIREFVI